VNPGNTMAAMDPAGQCPGVNAVILSGGGANGAYEVGVLKALLAGLSPATAFQPLAPGIITGTSIGGFNATSLVSFLQADDWPAAGRNLEQVWLDVIPQDDSTNHNHIYRLRGNPFEFLNPRILSVNPARPFDDLARDAFHLTKAFFDGASQVLAASGNIETRLATVLDFSALIDTEPSVRLVHQVIQAAKLRETGVQLRVIATNWDTGKVQVFSNRDMTDDNTDQIVQASTAMPGFFPSVVIDGNTYVDGTVVMNTPLVPALHAGADTLHVIYLDPAVSSIPVNTLHSTLDVLTRVFVVMFALKLNEDIKRAARVNRGARYVEEVSNAPMGAREMKDILSVTSLRPVVIHRYHPVDDIGEGLLGWLDFSRKRISSLIERGFNDAVHHDCVRSGCVRSDGTVLSPTVQAQAAANAPTA
jgi:NTE family protein